VNQNKSILAMVTPATHAKKNCDGLNVAGCFLQC